MDMVIITIAMRVISNGLSIISLDLLIHNSLNMDKGELNY